MVIPDGMPLLDWAAQLRIDFPDDDVPWLLDQDWRLWAAQVAERATFAEFGCPDPYGFEDWLGWANAVYRAAIEGGAG
jgi:hypothetical protein